MFFNLFVASQLVRGSVLPMCHTFIRHQPEQNTTHLANTIGKKGTLKRKRKIMKKIKISLKIKVSLCAGIDHCNCSEVSCQYADTPATKKAEKICYLFDNVIAIINPK